MSKDFLTTVNISPSNNSEDDGSMTYKCTRIFRSSRPEMFLGNGVLKIYRKITGEHQCRSVISIKLLCTFIDIRLRLGCSPINLLYIFRTPFPQNTYRGLLLHKSALFKTNHKDIRFTFYFILLKSSYQKTQRDLCE